MHMWTLSQCYMQGNNSTLTAGHNAKPIIVGPQGQLDPRQQAKRHAYAVPWQGIFARTRGQGLPCPFHQHTALVKYYCECESHVPLRLSYAVHASTCLSETALWQRLCAIGILWEKPWPCFAGLQRLPGLTRRPTTSHHSQMSVRNLIAPLDGLKCCLLHACAGQAIDVLNHNAVTALHQHSACLPKLLPACPNFSQKLGLPACPRTPPQTPGPPQPPAACTWR